MKVIYYNTNNRKLGIIDFGAEKPTIEDVITEGKDTFGDVVAYYQIKIEED